MNFFFYVMISIELVLLTGLTVLILQGFYHDYIEEKERHNATKKEDGK